MNALLVFLGGGLGAAARHGVNVLALRLMGPSFPIGTMLINILGSAAIGILVEYAALKGGLSMPMRLFLTTGILGGFTTFSAFSLDAVVLFQRGQAAAALMYVVGTVILGLVGLVAGMGLVRALSS